MYKQVETHKTVVLQNGMRITPVASLEDESGGQAHIWVDDHCYLLGVYVKSRDSKQPEYLRPTNYIFPEAFQVLKTLPELKAA